MHLWLSEDPKTLGSVANLHSIITDITKMKGKSYLVVLLLCHMYTPCTGQCC